MNNSSKQPFQKSQGEIGKLQVDFTQSQRLASVSSYKASNMGIDGQQKINNYLNDIYLNMEQSYNDGDNPYGYLSYDKEDNYDGIVAQQHEENIDAQNTFQKQKQYFKKSNENQNDTYNMHGQQLQMNPLLKKLILKLENLQNQNKQFRKQNIKRKKEVQQMKQKYQILNNKYKKVQQIQKIFYSYTQKIKFLQKGVLERQQNIKQKAIYDQKMSEKNRDIDNKKSPKKQNKYFFEKQRGKLNNDFQQKPFSLNPLQREPNELQNKLEQGKVDDSKIQKYSIIKQNFNI